MNWDAIGAIGEILSAIAVFSSLIYLAIQIRTQVRESRLNAMHDISAGFREILANFTKPETVALLQKANENYDALSKDEAIRFMSFSGQYFLAWEEAYIQHSEGRLTDRSWNSISKYFSNGLGLPGFRRAWAVRKTFFDPKFVEYVDRQDINEYTTK